MKKNTIKRSLINLSLDTPIVSLALFVLTMAIVCALSMHSWVSIFSTYDAKMSFDNGQAIITLELDDWDDSNFTFEKAYWSMPDDTSQNICICQSSYKSGDLLTVTFIAENYDGESYHYEIPVVVEVETQEISLFEHILGDII